MILSSQKWETVENLNRKGRAWFFTGSPPPDASKQTYWRYNMGKNKNGHEWYIEVQVASRPQKAPNQRPLKDPNSGSIKRVFGDFLSPTGNVSTETPKPKSKGREKGFPKLRKLLFHQLNKLGSPMKWKQGKLRLLPTREPRVRLVVRRKVISWCHQRFQIHLLLMPLNIPKKKLKAIPPKVSIPLLTPKMLSLKIGHGLTWEEMGIVSIGVSLTSLSRTPKR